MRTYLIYRLLTIGIYFAHFMLIGNNWRITLWFIGVLAILDFAYLTIHKWLVSKFPINLLTGSVWALGLIFVVAFFSTKLQVSAFQSQHIINPLLEKIQFLYKDVTYKKLLVYLGGYLFAMHGSNRLIGWILSDLKVVYILDEHTPAVEPEITQNVNGVEGQQGQLHLISLKRAGRYIGSLERIFVITIILLKDYAFALGFIFTAKTIVRFDFTKRNGEYYLIGTLTSLLLALCLASLMKLMLKV